MVVKSKKNNYIYTDSTGTECGINQHGSYLGSPLSSEWHFVPPLTLSHAWRESIQRDLVMNAQDPMLCKSVAMFMHNYLPDTLAVELNLRSVAKSSVSRLLAGIPQTLLL